EHQGATGAFVIALIIWYGNQNPVFVDQDFKVLTGFKANISPLVAEQYKLFVVVTKSGETRYCRSF
ncbi:hypothetical protein BYT27DRAFT_7242985, partial [Phlegmacium glaucopus]